MGSTVMASSGVSEPNGHSMGGFGQRHRYEDHTSLNEGKGGYTFYSWPLEVFPSTATSALLVAGDLYTF